MEEFEVAGLANGSVGLWLGWYVAGELNDGGQAASYSIIAGKLYPHLNRPTSHPCEPTSIRALGA